MPFAAVAGGLAAGVGGSLVSGLMSPGTSGGGGGGGGMSYYIPSGLSSADTAWQNLFSQQQANQQNVNSVSPYYAQSLNEGLSANQAMRGGYMNAANQAGQQYGALGSRLNQFGLENIAQQNALLNAGQNVYQTALDPQNALYRRTVQQLQDQTGATNSMYGLGSSAAGAGVANQALSNFNIDWQNQQLQRQLQGLQGYAGAANTAGRYGELGTSQMQSAPGYTLMGGQLPYQTAQSIASYPGQLASTYSGQMQQGPLSSASALTSQVIPYLNYGQGAQAIPYQNQTQGAGALGGLVSQGISGLGNAIQGAGGFGNFFNGTTGSFGGGDFSGAFTSNPYYSGGGNSYGFTM